MKAYDKIKIKMDFRRPACIETPAPIFEPTMQYDNLERARQELRGLHAEMVKFRFANTVPYAPKVNVLTDISLFDLIVLTDQCASALALLEYI